MSNFRPYDDASLARNGKRKPQARPVPPPDATAPDSKMPTLGGDALYGLPGDAVRLIEPHTEAAAVALLFQFLVAFGNCIGRRAHWTLNGGAVQHFGNEFLVLVGRTASGRKGTSWSEIRRLFKGDTVKRIPSDDGFTERAGWAVRLDDAFSRWEQCCIRSGASSGEGIIAAVHDEVVGWDAKNQCEIVAAPAVEDKRLLLLEPEFAKVLKQAERQGNVLSALLREAWESGTLSTLTKSPMTATGAHVSIVAHVTATELLRLLSATESANGFANRFFFVAVDRSKFLPNGGSLTEKEILPLRCRLQAAVDFAAKVGVVERDGDAGRLWEQVYPQLSADRPGLAGGLCGRAEAHTMRLAMLYALLDRSAVIRVEHLRAALACWGNCEQSVYFIFGDALGDPTADEILQALRVNPDGLTRTAISNLFGRNRPAGEIGRALGLLMRLGRATMTPTERGGGEIWKATKSTNCTKT